jgi:3-hydroxyacyl-[acyl-carrier-protein] dehydratase
VTTASFPVDPGDPVFPGHYPGYPVLPGVQLIEYADRAARALPALRADGPPVRLAAVERCRFLAPVYPGDTVTVTVTVSADVAVDPAADGTGTGLRCTAEAATGRGPAADITLRYRRGTAG